MGNFCLLLVLIGFAFISTSQQQGCPNVGISQKTFDENVIQIEWFNNEQYVYAVTRSSVYVSRDEGQTWDKKELGTGTISELYLTADEKKQFVLEYEDKRSTLWKTSDHGAKWDQVEISELVFDIYPHPTDSNWAFVHTYSQGCLSGSGSCTQNIHLTQDFGETWRKVSEGIHRFSWGNAGKDGAPKEMGFQLRAENPASMRTSPRRFERTSNLFKSVDTTITSAVDFGYYYGTLYVAQVISNSVKLLVSNDGGKNLKVARFPTTFDERSYTIINDIAGLSYIAVDHSAPGSPVRWTNVYVTDFASDAYVLSQEYVTKDQKGKVDFTGINLDGVQISNVYKLDQEPVPNSQSVVVSTITWDNGGQWNAIDGPSDSSCPPEAPHCDIHFQGRSSGFAIESSASAIGLVVATGNTGDLLDDDALNTYLSRDAGLTWMKIAQGTKVYQFSDHGGLLLLAEDEWPTKSVLYSWDKGTSFTNCSFGDKDYLITWIGTAPSGTSQNYLVIQSTTDGTGKPLSIITHLDFSSLHKAQCVDADYEWWRPSDGSSDFCLLGREIQFKRRKADAQCFNPENFETKKITTYCACTREDYGCDYCYEEITTGQSAGECKRTCEYDPAAPPADCSGHYTKTQGYRLVAGDQCQGGLNLNPQTCDCQGQNCVNNLPTTTTTTSGSTTGSSGGGSGGASAGTVVGILFLILLIFAVLTACIIFYLYRNNEQVRTYVDEHTPTMPKIPWFGRSSGSTRSNVMYSTLDPSNADNVEVDPFVDEEEATELNDHQIVQMKTLNSHPETDAFNPRADPPSQPPSLI